MAWRNEHIEDERSLYIVFERRSTNDPSLKTQRLGAVQDLLPNFQANSIKREKLSARAACWLRVSILEDACEGLCRNARILVYGRLHSSWLEFASGAAG